MKTRRNFLKTIWRTMLAAIGVSAIIAAAHKLLDLYPARYPADQSEQNLSKWFLRRTGLDRLIRPPGAVAEEAFLAGCIRCNRCQDACEPGAIQYLTEQHGKLAHTPVIDPAIKACTLCMKCTEVCPTGVIKQILLEEKDKADMGSVELQVALCLSHKAKRIRAEQALLMELGQSATESTAPDERRGPCGECFMFCPLRGKAIRLEPGAFLAPEIFIDECVGCGMCEEICRVVVRGEPAIRVVPNRKLFN